MVLRKKYPIQNEHKTRPVTDKKDEKKHLTSEIPLEVLAEETLKKAVAKETHC